MEKEIMHRFFSAIQKDPRISITHIGIFAALMEYRNGYGAGTDFCAFSYEIMKIAKISASATYHKCIKDLDRFGYISYTPSFKRSIGSRISLIRE